MFSDVLTVQGTSNANHGHMKDKVQLWAREYKSQAKSCTGDGYRWDTAKHLCYQTGGRTLRLATNDERAEYSCGR